MGIKRPPPFPYALNSAVDALLKEEFDEYRKRGDVHPLLISNKIKGYKRYLKPIKSLTILWHIRNTR